MAYKWATKSAGDPEEWFEGNEIVVVATGSHDCSRLIQALRSGNCEQSRLGEQIARSLNRHPLGRRVTELLKRHGGEDLTELADSSELDRLRDVVWNEGDPWESVEYGPFGTSDFQCKSCGGYDASKDNHSNECAWLAEDQRRKDTQS